MSYTCHGGFSDGAPSMAHFFFAAQKNHPELGWTKKKPSKDLMFWKVVWHPIELAGIELFDCKFFDISPAEARGGNGFQCGPRWCLFCWKWKPERYGSNATSSARGTGPWWKFWKGRKGSSFFFCFATVVRMFIWKGIEVSFNVRKSCANILKESNNNVFSNL